MTRLEIRGLPDSPESWSEADLQRFIAGADGLATLLGWDTLHVRAGRQRPGSSWSVPISGSLGKGWPDLILARAPRLVAAELKRRPNVPTADQRRVLAVLASCGVETYVWYPEDLDAIAATLR